MSALDAVTDQSDTALPAIDAPDTPEPETGAVQLTTTDEAKKYARQALDDYYGHNRQNEDSIAREATVEANKAKAALRAAQQRLMSDPYAPSEGEQTGRLGTALMTPGPTPWTGIRAMFQESDAQKQQARERQAALASQSLGYDTQAQGINDKLFALRQKLAADQEKNSATLAKQGLQTLGRSIPKDGTAPGSKPLSNFGKIAADAGLVPGTPEYVAEVKRQEDVAIKDAQARSGTDAEDLDPRAKALLADNNGLPAQIIDPFANLSTKEKQRAMAIELTKHSQNASKFADQDRQTGDLLGQVDNFLYLNQHTHTGPELAGLTLPGLSAGPHGASVHGGEGFNLNPWLAVRKFDPNIQDMDKISNNILTNMQKPGFSRITNMDLATFQKGMMGIDKPYEVNSQIAVPLKVWGKDQTDYHDFLSQYFALHHTEQGAESAWHGYLTSPVGHIFDPAHPGSLKLNPDRIPWQDYFRRVNRGEQFQSVDIPNSALVEPKRAHPDSEAGRAEAAAHGAANFGSIQRPPIPAAAADVTALGNPGMRPGQDPGAPPLRAPAWQPDDDVPAKAEGGSVSMADRLKALRAGQIVGQPGVDPRPVTQDPGVQTGDPREQAIAIERLKQLLSTPVDPNQMADGGEVEDPGELSSLLAALRTGATFHGSEGQENRHAPMTNFVGETAGGAGTAALTALALAKLRGRVGRGAAALGRYAVENPNKAAIGAGAGVGAASGILGAPQGEGIYYGPGGALVGAGIGPLAAATARSGSRGLSSLADRVRGLPGISSGDKRTVGAVERDLSNAGGGANWQDLTDAVRDDKRLGVPSTIADMPEMTATRGLAKAALSKDSAAGRSFSDDLAARQGNAGERVGDIVNKGLVPDPYLAQQQKLKDALYTNADPLYKAAYQAFPQVKSKTLMGIMDTPAGQEAAARTNIKMQNQKKPLGIVNPSTGLIEQPSLEYLDNYKRTLDDMIGREEGSGPTYKPTDDGRVLRHMRDSLKNEVDRATMVNGQPGPYQAARGQYAGDLEVLDALRSGREEFQTLSPEAIQQKVGGMSYAEKDAFRSGVAEGLFRQLGAPTGEGANPAMKVLGGDDFANKIGAIFDKPADATRFMSGLQREAQMFGESKPLITAGKRGEENSMVPNSIASLMKSRFMTEQTANDVAANMAGEATDPHALDKIARLRDAADRLRSRDTIAARVGAPVAAGAATASIPSNINQPAEQDQP